ncbi:MAG: hypothetical protein R3218_03775, partial [Christiangramia sp.]|nr:hypothetical protein [Christiangramia sp.]
MKIKKHYIISLLLLQVFLLTSENAFAFSRPSLDLDSGPGEYLRTHQNKKAVLFEDFVSEVDFRLTSEDENDLQFTLSN